MIKQTLLINLLYYPLYSLGPGVRVGIWFQGCSIQCKGCISDHTWAFDSQYEQYIDDVLEKLRPIYEQSINRITISGGEPFDQPESLKQLLKGCRKIGFKDILVYTGYHYVQLITMYRDIFQYIDVLIDGNFQSGNTSEYIWKGSDNQQLILLSNDSQIVSQYYDFQNTVDLNTPRSIELIKNNSSIVVIGIPRQEDVEIIHETL